MADSTPRRDFLKTSAAVALSAPAVLRAQNATDKLNIGWIGVGTRGYAGLDWLHKAAPDNVAVTAICDTYTGHLARAPRTAFRRSTGSRPRRTTTITICSPTSRSTPSSS